MPESVLLVCPAFHGYGASLGAALRRAGHQVRVHPYDLFSSLADKTRNKVLYELPERLGRPGGDARRRQALTREAVAVLRETRPDVVLVIRGDLLATEFWHEAWAQGSRVVLWLYDELRRMSHDQETLRGVDTLITYSPQDAAALTSQGITTHCIANAFDETVPFTAEDHGAVLFVGARYPNREAAMLSLHRAEVPVLAVGRSWSSHPFDRIRTWELHRPDLPAMRDVPRDRAYGLMAGAPASLNVHTDQDGFTMRTFEASGAGGVQLIDRPDVAEFYEPGKEILVYTSPEEMLDLARRAVTERVWGRTIGEAGRRRTLAHHTFTHRVRELEQVWG